MATKRQIFFSVKLKSPDGDEMEFIVDVKHCIRPSMTKVWRRMRKLSNEIDFGRSPLEGYDVIRISWSSRESAPTHRYITDVLGKDESGFILDYLLN